MEARLGRTVFGPGPEFLIDGVLEPGKPSGWKATLSLVDARGNVLGSREVSTREEACSALEPRLLLVMAVMIDPSAALGGPPPESPPAPEPPPLPTVAEPPAPVETPAPAVTEAMPPPPEESPGMRPDAPGPRLGGPAVTVAALGSLGVGFGVTPGIATSFWLGRGAWPWLIRLTLSPYESYTKDGGRLSLVKSGAEVGVCPVSWAGGEWSASGCATATFALVLAYSEGFEQGRLEPLARGDVGPRARLERRLGASTALHLGVGVGYGWLRPTVRLLKPDGTAEDQRLGLPVQASVDVGVSFLGP
ncbi:hypothetical protein DAT35_49085 [Vitiosangium sp. GDMCC 1.1324]|nr:hypothetical protein DAT35_49085 [Vitiosangium sp. GDMCC 1.1324]